MSNNQASLSETEQAVLQKTVVNLCHLFLGDQIVYSEDKMTNEHILESREKLWLNAIANSGKFNTRVYGLRKELQLGFKFLTKNTRSFRAPADELSYMIFDRKPTDKLAAYILVYLMIAQSLRIESKDYSEITRQILNELGITEGLFDINLPQLTLKEILHKLLLLDKVWWEEKNEA